MVGNNVLNPKITPQDRAELRQFEMYLRRRAEKPDEPSFVAYGEIYGEVVFADREEAAETSREGIDG